MILHRLKIKTRPGISIIIAMMIVMAFMLTMASIMTAMTRSFKIAKGGMAADQAYLNAQAGLEIGLYQQNKPEKFDAMMKNVFPGYKGDGVVQLENGGVITFKVADTIEGGGQVCGDKNITSPDFTKADDLEKCKGSKLLYYTYPFPGGGTMGGNYCNPKTQPLIMNEQWYRDAYYFLMGSEYTGSESLMTLAKNGNTSKKKSDWKPADVAQYISTKLEPLDHPCLWNTLEPGVSAEIPLFNNEEGPKNLQEFWLRVRLPCKEGILCNAKVANIGDTWNSERMALDIKKPKKGEDDEEEEKEEVAVLIWDVVGTCPKEGEKEKVLCFMNGVSSKMLQQKAKEASLDIKSSDIPKQKSSLSDQLLTDKNLDLFTENNIQSIVLGLKNKMHKSIYALNDNDPTGVSKITDFFQLKGLEKPIMHLSIASDLKTKQGISIPRVEYQILYKNSAFGKSKPLIRDPVVISSGQYGGYTINLQSSLTKQTGTFGYSVIGK